MSEDLRGNAFSIRQEDCNMVLCKVRIFPSLFRFHSFHVEEEAHPPIIFTQILLLKYLKKESHIFHILQKYFLVT